MVVLRRNSNSPHRHRVSRWRTFTLALSRINVFYYYDAVSRCTAVKLVRPTIQRYVSLIARKDRITLRYKDV